MRRELGHVRLEVFVDQFEVYRRHLLTTPMPSGRLRKGVTVNRKTEVVRAVFGHLVALELLDRNPITPHRFPKFKERPRDRVLTQEEELRLMNAIREHRPHILPIIQYMMDVPCRISELVNARREQYNPFTQTIYIPDSKADIPIYKPIPADMIGYFQGIPEDCEWLFYQKSTGKYRGLTRKIVDKAWRHCLECADIADMHIHDLRHMAVTKLYEAGNSVEVIKSIAGWKTDMLSNYYHKDGLRHAQNVVWGRGSAAGAVPVPWRRVNATTMPLQTVVKGSNS